MRVLKQLGLARGPGRRGQDTGQVIWVRAQAIRWVGDEPIPGLVRFISYSRMARL